MDALILQGKSACSGVAIGEIFFYPKREREVRLQDVTDAEAEVARFNDANKTAVEELTQIYESALRDIGEEEAMIFDVHRMMLEDDDFCSSIMNIIRTSSVNAEYAVARTGENYEKMFSEMDNEYMRARAADIRDITSRLLDILTGAEKVPEIISPVIIAAVDLTPSETVRLKKDKTLAFITAQGSQNSHTAILARTMNIPAVVGLGSQISPELSGLIAIVDGAAGIVFLNPDESTLKEYQAKKQEQDERQKLLSELKGKPNQTKSGKTIDIYANIGGEHDTDAVLQNDAGGIGLFRSEFLYLESNDYPSEDKQFSVYKRVLERLGGKRVVVRTMDIGADKQIDYFNLPKEENPALGYRAIRICLTRPDIFKTQLRALFRASVYGKLAIMFPMIISVEEVAQIKKIVDEVKASLVSENVPFAGDIELGIMIETPAAAIMSDELAKLVDFFSIGSNDLTQYTLAIDRQNQNLDQFCDTHHPAILHLIKMVARNAHKNGIWVGICGELGADLALTELFVNIEIDELSVSPSQILTVREKVRGLD